MLRHFISKWSHFTRSLGAEALSAQLYVLPNPHRCVSNGGTSVPKYRQRAIQVLQKTASLFPGKEGGNRTSREGKGR